MISEGAESALNDSTQGALVDGVPKADVDAPTEALTNEDAIGKLYGANSVLKPVLLGRGYRLVRRVFDIVASSAAIAVLLVLGLVLAFAIYAKSSGASPLYSQLRVGRLRKDGTYRLFRMWKFHSMVPNADEMLADLRDRGEVDGPLFKFKDDPRVVPGVGRFFRCYSIDELAQMFNVFAGDIPLRILKTCRGFSLETFGAFALPARLARTLTVASLQVKAVFFAVVEMLQTTSNNLIASYGEPRGIFAKRSPLMFMASFSAVRGEA